LNKFGVNAKVADDFATSGKAQVYHAVKKIFYTIHLIVLRNYIQSFTRI